MSVGETLRGAGGNRSPLAGSPRVSYLPSRSVGPREEASELGWELGAAVTQRGGRAAQVHQRTSRRSLKLSSDLARCRWPCRLRRKQCQILLYVCDIVAILPPEEAAVNGTTVLRRSDPSGRGGDPHLSQETERPTQTRP